MISWDFIGFPLVPPGDLDSQHEEQCARPGASAVMALGWTNWPSVAAETHCIKGAKLPSFVRHLGQNSISNKFNASFLGVLICFNIFKWLHAELGIMTFALDSIDIRQFGEMGTENSRQSPASRCVEQRTGSYLEMTWPPKNGTTWNERHWPWDTYGHP